MNTLSWFSSYDWDTVLRDIYATTPRQVEQALARSRRTLDDFKALISPAAQAYLEPMAQLSHQLTQQRFGRTIQMYAPLYLSNECQNICTYCAFSLDNKIRRRTLTDDEILREAEAIRQMGYEHVLLVTGEANQTVGVPYLKNAIRLLQPHFAHVSIEVQPLDQPEYEELIAEGLNTVLIYQETYHQATYRNHHPRGKKSNFAYRLETPNRLGRAGIHKIGLGALLGLEDWRTDSFFTATHLHYLERTYWQTRYSISFPRLRPIDLLQNDTITAKSFERCMSDRDLVQLICAYRLFNEEVELSLSTRETPRFRDHVLKLGITSLSAGSKTNPGGYVVEPQSLEQFAISDERSPAEMADVIRQQGYEPVWKDWDKTFAHV
ncbi:2-iminoacetate synthase ThiH [Spirosoma sp. KUDC1026]|uniref:2-iminoacetate synthase ThiH n=1 Tax=Spirosoma sp. KUDC1026 TaxID=2745947 RepID=UPI00159BBECF|nr:2-iminoacetate synthase ThiH [Spirosoma sp. KUDC1026]QKZ14751.1 2-iminoacetate synthase ThiH [Spirosoma sp. KUDC1026]